MNVVTATPIGGGSYKWLVLFNVMLTTFMAVLDSTVVNTGLPVIMGTLGASMNSAEWILTGYMLSMATILPAAGWLSDRSVTSESYFLVDSIYSGFVHVWQFHGYRGNWYSGVYSKESGVVC